MHASNWYPCSLQRAHWILSQDHSGSQRVLLSPKVSAWYQKVLYGPDCSFRVLKVKPSGPSWTLQHTLVLWNPERSYLDIIGMLLRLFWDHFETTLGPFWDTSGTPLGPFWDPFGTLKDTLNPSLWDPFRPFRTIWDLLTIEYWYFRVWQFYSIKSIKIQ